VVNVGTGDVWSISMAQNNIKESTYPIIDSLYMSHSVAQQEQQNILHWDMKNSHKFLHVTFSGSYLQQYRYEHKVENIFKK